MAGVRELLGMYVCSRCSVFVFMPCHFILWPSQLSSYCDDMVDETRFFEDAPCLKVSFSPDMVNKAFRVNSDEDFVFGGEEAAQAVWVRHRTPACLILRQVMLTHAFLLPLFVFLRQ